MGTWGPGPLEDDTALDFAEALMSSPDPAEQLAAAVRLAARPGRHLDHTDAVRAVVAAVLLAGTPLTGRVRRWRRATPITVPPDLAATALRAMEHAHSPGSGLYERHARIGQRDEAWAALAPAVQALHDAPP